MSEIIKNLLGTALRHGANAVGAFLVTKGYIDADQAAALVNYIVGGGLIAVAAVISVVLKSKK